MSAINKEEAWNEIEEAHCSLTTLSISEIEECLEAITNRLEKAMKLVQPTQKCYLTVMWGENPKLAENEPQLYTFNSIEERNAFCKGADEADGWHGADWHKHDTPKTFKNEEFHNWENE